MSNTSNVIKIQTPERLRCASCGATTEAACDCGVGYEPVSARIEKAFAARPELSKLSDRVVADTIGVSHDSVRQMRTAGDDRSSPDGSAYRRRTVTGKDGKIYPAKRVAAERAATSECAPDEAIRITAGYLRTAIFDPPEGIRARLKEAMARASAEDVRVIATAAAFLAELLEAAK